MSSDESENDSLRDTSSNSSDSGTDDASPFQAGSPASANTTMSLTPVSSQSQRDVLKENLKEPVPGTSTGVVVRPVMLDPLFSSTKLPPRFWSKALKLPSGCWLWVAATLRSYGRFRFGPDGTSTKLAYRGAYLRLIGPVASGLELDHTCLNKLCVNPHHLEPVTHLENVYRGSLPAVSFLKHAAKTHCPASHPYDQLNTYITPKGGRQCRTCERARHAKALGNRRPASKARTQHRPY